MAEHRTRKNKESPNYNFLYSWTPKNTPVKGNLASSKKTVTHKLSASKKADNLAKDKSQARTKKDIVRSLILVGFILALEVVIYLAWSRFRTF